MAKTERPKKRALSPRALFLTVQSVATVYKHLRGDRSIYDVGSPDTDPVAVTMAKMIVALAKQ